MPYPDSPSQDGNSQEERTEAQARPTALQSARACFLKGVSYFSGDMEVFGKWMESKLKLAAYIDN